MPEPRRRGRRKKRLPEEAIEVTIDALSAEGRGIAHVNGRTVFIAHALAGERVLFRYTRLKKNVAEGKVVKVLEASPDRLEPQCEVFEVCGGCSLQHMESKAQLALKQKTLLDHLQHIGQVIPENIFEPVTGPLWSYRQKARLGVRYVHKKEKVLVGFRERGSSFITETNRCEVLHKSVGLIINDLSDCIGQMEMKQHIPQIEVAVGDNQTVLVFRHLEPLPDGDRQLLCDIAVKHELVIYLQAGAPDKLEVLWPEKSSGRPDNLFYEIPDYDLRGNDIRLEFQPADFTQVNSVINRKMIDKTIDFLKFEKDDQVLDLFCGLGNFSLAMARRCSHVTGVEGSIDMVKRARENASKNNIDNVEFVLADLYDEEISSAPWVKKKYDKILLDPPRSGANVIMKYLGKMDAERIVYVSCHPATLARDAHYIVNELGYTLIEAGILDMFPHTAHVESMAVFVKKQT